ncbi:MAG: M14 family metallopeptidase [Bacteroidota bacterium]|nr:M14 family metallopeptidase [Bacteroidota bacterium]
MKKYRGIIAALIVLLQPLHLAGQKQYTSYKELSAEINQLGKLYPGLCAVKSLARTGSGKDVWLISIGSEPRDSKPGVAIVGGVDGSYLLGRELAVGFAERILKNATEKNVKELLDKLTFYVLPDVSPDESDQYFSKPQYERSLNSRSVDDDRDFKADEDPCEDLNNDGFISLIRIKDPAGKYIESEEDNRIMVEADISKGQTGEYLVYTEGIDNDKDGSFNEDGPGGVSFNRNFTFNYEEFGKGSGLYPVSEPESGAVADFLFDRFNVYAVFTFGPQDNLGQPVKASERQTTGPGPSQPQGQQQGPPQGPPQGQMIRERSIITAILKSDEPVNKLVSDKYHEITRLKGSPVSVTSPGNFADWAYFHYGRYSFTTPGWWYPVEKGKNAEAAFLKYAEKNEMKDAFIPWTEISHPDFPEKKTEVGGLKPFVIHNPPADSLESIISNHYRFITEVASMHPDLEFLDVKVENAGENIFRLTLKVHNKGIFATCAEIGDQFIWTRIMRITLDPSGNQKIESGQKVQRIQRLLGDETAEFTWLISGRGSVQVTAGAANVGIITTRVDLK